MPVYDSLTKFNARIDAIDRMPDLMQSAFRAATTGEPRPVHLEISHPFGMGMMDDEFQTDLSFDNRYGQFPAHQDKSR